MNSREAKRVAAAILSRYARGRAEDGRRAASEGYYLFAPEVVTAHDTERVCRALVELADELERRVTGDRKPRLPSPLDPDQLSWLDLEAMTS